MSKYQEKFYLAEFAKIYPVVDGWSAWPYVLAPVPACLTLAKYQLPIMESYLKYPQDHMRSGTNPKMVGGPYMVISPERKDEVARLLERTREHRCKELAFAEALMGFQKQFFEQAQGQCLESSYTQVPEILKGYVELVYDYHHRPHLRFYEPALYRGSLYRDDLQGFRLFPLQSDEDIPFFMTTPLLDEEDHLQWSLPFHDPKADMLFQMDLQPRALGEVAELLEVEGEEKMDLLQGLLTREPPPSRETPPADEVFVSYVGHACVMFEYAGQTLLTDACIPVKPQNGAMERIGFRDLPARIDFLLITHLHQDHFVVETLLRLRYRVDTVVVPRASGFLFGDISYKHLLYQLGFKNVLALDPLETLPLADGEIIGAPFLGEHGDLGHSKLSYVLRLGQQQILVAADSDCLEPAWYQLFRKYFGRVSCAFIGTESVGAPLSWVCGPFFPERVPYKHEMTRRYHGANAERAMEMLRCLGCEQVFTYALGREPWLFHLLGLTMVEEAPQMVEARKLHALATEQGLYSCSLYGSREFSLEKVKVN